MYTDRHCIVSQKTKQRTKEYIKKKTGLKETKTNETGGEDRREEERDKLHERLDCKELASDSADALGFALCCSELMDF